MVMNRGVVWSACKRVLALVLVISSLLFLIPNISPEAAAFDYSPDVSYWSLFLEGLENWFSGETGFSLTGLETDLSFPVTGQVTMSELEDARDYYNSWINVLYRSCDLTPPVSGFCAVIRYDYVNGIQRLADNNTGDFIVDSFGRFPYVLQADSAAILAQNLDTSEQTMNQWIDFRSVSFDRVVVLSQDVLAQAVSDLNNRGVNCTLSKVQANTLWAITQNDISLAFYCNSSGYVYVAPAAATVTDVQYDYIDNSNNTTINDSQIIDVTNGVLNVINENGEQKTLNIDSLVFDFSDHSYTVNAYDTTYNNYYYEYNYYTYNVSYAYEYTYVTYIGSTVEYEPEEYALYYELPDGRSSADLTADEIAGMSLDFDVVNYDRQYTDTRTRALYHFDGVIKDDSYYSGSGSFVWSNGASITYLDSNAFGGCLYLDSAYHDFNININYIPGVDSNFTLQWRMYVGGIGSINWPSYGMVQCNGAYVLFFDSDTFYAGTGTGYDANKTYPISIGSWMDVCVVKSCSTLYTFINGVLAFYTNTTAPYSSGQIRFYLPVNLFPYVYIDEFRFVDFAVYSTKFFPSPVPYDTNNVFVLPEIEGLDDMTIAVQHDIPIRGYRVGGVRPTFPATGMTWFPVSDGRVIDCQIYNGSYWESVECRLWTGVRWIPLWAFDIVTLSDMYDIAYPADIVIPITSETGFWSWWQSQWLDFRSSLETTLSNIGGGTVDAVPSSPSDSTFPGSEAEGESWSFFDLLGAVKDGAWNVTKGIAGSFFGGVSGLIVSLVNVGDFFDVYDSSSPDNIFGIMNYGGTDIWG